MRSRTNINRYYARALLSQHTGRDAICIYELPGHATGDKTNYGCRRRIPPKFGDFFSYDKRVDDIGAARIKDPESLVIYYSRI